MEGTLTMGNILKTGAVKTGITAAALLAALVAALAGPALADDMRTPSPAGAAVYFANLTDRATAGAPVARRARTSGRVTTWKATSSTSP